MIVGPHGVGGPYAPTQEEFSEWLPGTAENGSTARWFRYDAKGKLGAMVTQRRMGDGIEYVLQDFKTLTVYPSFPTAEAAMFAYELMRGG